MAFLHCTDAIDVQAGHQKYPRTSNKWCKFQVFFCIKNIINTKSVSIDDPFLLNKKDELTPSRKKTQFFSYYTIFLLSSKLSDLRPCSQNIVILSLSLSLRPQAYV